MSRRVSRDSAARDHCARDSCFRARDRSAKTRLVSLIAKAPERILPRCSRNFRNPYFAGSKCDSDQRRKPPVQLMSTIV
jgi:hypothetical protein